MDRPESTFPQLLREALRRDPGRPFITAYDEASGARTELSVTTYANWVNKTANLLVDEYLLDEGDTVRINIGPHWLGPVFVGAAWQAGVAVTTDASTACHLIMTGPSFDEAALASDLPIVASSLDAFAGRFREPLPEGVDDFGALWPGQPDAFVASATPGAMTAAWRDGGQAQSHEDLITQARALTALRRGSRLLTSLHPLAESAVPTLLAALVGGGSLVLVAHPRDTNWGSRYDAELPTDVLS